MDGSGKRACAYSLLVTVFLVGIYWLGKSINLPFVDSMRIGVPISIFALGYTPLITGFILVELFSLIIPAGRLLRRGGSEGREKLNRASMVVSIFLCIFQSFMAALALEKLSAGDGLGPLMSHGWFSRLLLFVTLTAGTVFIFCIARLISRWGIANGFCVLIAADILVPLVRQLWFGYNNFRTIAPAHGIEVFGIAAVVLAGLFFYFKRRIPFPVHLIKSPKSISLELPVFPQGVLPLIWASYLTYQVTAVDILLRSRSSEILSSIWFLLPGYIVLIVVFSSVGVLMFSNRKRIMNNLPFPVRLDDNFEQLLHNQAIRSTVVLVIGISVLVILGQQFGQGYVPYYANLIFLVAIALDVIEQGRFSWKHGKGIELIELDNPHLASCLKNLLQLNGVDAVVQTYHYRRLLFFFGPLIKMRILVAAEDYEKARKQIDSIDIRIV